MTHNNKKQLRFTLVTFFIAIILVPGTLLCNDIRRVEFPSSPNPVGSGARALGMGGAFIAVADDATAASWNPGGLTQIQLPEISFVGNIFHCIEDNTFGAEPEASGIQTVSTTDINYFSAAYPFYYMGRNMVVSLNYQHLYNFSREWDFPLTWNTESVFADQNVIYRQEGRLSAFGIAYGTEITPEFSIGLTFNAWDDRLTSNHWDQKTYQNGTINGEAYEAIYSDRYSFRGYNANIGLLWENARGNFSIGAVLKTPFTADLEHEHSRVIVRDHPQSPHKYKRNETLDMPMSYGIGFRYKISDTFRTSIDVYRTHWDDFVLTDSEGNETSPITALPVAESVADPTQQVRMGAEYIFITSEYVLSLCCGAFYDPAPSEGSPDDFFGFSIGTGIGYEIGLKDFKFDVAYQYRFGNNVGTSFMKDMELSQDVDEHTVYASLIIRF